MLPEWQRWSVVPEMHTCVLKPKTNTALLSLASYIFPSFSFSSACNECASSLSFHDVLCWATWAREAKHRNKHCSADQVGG